MDWRSNCQNFLAVRCNSGTAHFPAVPFLDVHLSPGTSSEYPDWERTILLFFFSAHILLKPFKMFSTCPPITFSSSERMQLLHDVLRPPWNPWLQISYFRRVSHANIMLITLIYLSPIPWHHLMTLETVSYSIVLYSIEILQDCVVSKTLSARRPHSLMGVPPTSVPRLLAIFLVSSCRLRPTSQPRERERVKD